MATISQADLKLLCLALKPISADLRSDVGKWAATPV